MNCPACGYAIPPNDLACPRCSGKGPAGVGPATGVPPAPQPGDSPSFVMALIGFCIPLAGLILFLIERGKRPLLAGSAGRGAILGAVAVPIVIAAAVVAVMRPIYSDVYSGLLDEAALMADDDGSGMCRTHLRQLRQATVAYTLAHEGKLPDLSSAASIRKALGPRVRDQKIFSCPVSQTPYIGNAALSGKVLSKIPRAAKVRLFYDEGKSNRHQYGFNVAYAGGHVEMETQP